MLYIRIQVIKKLKYEISKASDILKTIWKFLKLLICNGGSASDPDHIVGELVKGFEKES